MPVNRDLYRPILDEEQVPSWTCGSCGVGTLRSLKDAFKYEEGRSKLIHKEDFFEPFMIGYRFTCFAECTNGQCKEVAVIAGDGDVLEDWDSQGRTLYDTQFTVRFVTPAPRLFVISNDLPQSVKEELEKAFGLFWSDFNACLNALRSALETALDERKIPRFKYSKPNKSGKKRRIRQSLHDRIGLLSVDDELAKEMLMASKWISNTGSHGEDVELTHVYDALDLVEHAVNLLFDKSNERLRKLAKKVTKKKGPA